MDSKQLEESSEFGLEEDNDVEVVWAKSARGVSDPGMFLMENCISLVIYVSKSGSLRIWHLQRSWCLPPRQEQSQPPNRLVRLCKQVLNRLPKRPHAPLPPPYQPVLHTICPSSKPIMCHSPKGLVHKVWATPYPSRIVVPTTADNELCHAFI